VLCCFQVSLILALGRADDFTGRAGEGGAGGGVGAELVKFALAVAVKLLLGSTLDLTHVADEVDGVFQFEMRLGGLVRLQVLLGLALVFAQRTEEGLALTTIDKAVADPTLMVVGLLGRVKGALTITDALALNDAESTGTWRVLDVVERTLGGFPAIHRPATRSPASHQFWSFQQSSLTHTFDQDLLGHEAKLILARGDDEEVGDRQGLHIARVLLVPPRPALIIGHGFKVGFEVGGEAVEVHCLWRLLYFAVFCVNDTPPATGKIAVSCVMTYFGKAWFLRNPLLPKSLSIILPFPV